MQVSLEADRPIVSACRKTSFYHHSHSHNQRQGNGGTGGGGAGGAGAGGGGATHMSHSSSNVLRARRGVVRMLIIFVLTFALCNLPYHARKMWQYWWVDLQFPLRVISLLVIIIIIIMISFTGMGTIFLSCANSWREGTFAYSASRRICRLSLRY